MPLRHMEEWRYRSTHSYTQY